MFMAVQIAKVSSSDVFNWAGKCECKSCGTNVSFIKRLEDLGTTS